MKTLACIGIGIFVLAAFFGSLVVLPWISFLAAVSYFVKQLVSPTKERRSC